MCRGGSKHDEMCFFWLCVALFIAMECMFGMDITSTTSFIDEWLERDNIMDYAKERLGGGNEHGETGESTSFLA